VEAPLAVKVLERPRADKMEGSAAHVTLGAWLTTTVVLADDESPDEFVPVTEYVEVVLGWTTILAVVSPVLHR
jgi:hypothetical protein